MKGHPRSAPLAPNPSFVEHLKGKSRRRRQDLAGLAEAEAAWLPRRNDLLPRLELAHVPLDMLKMPAHEVRKLQPAHVRQVANAIAALGFCVPILIGKYSLVLDGAARVEAARSLGLERVPCVRIEHLSDDEQRVLRLAVNRLGETGSWSLEALKIEFEELILADAPIEISGFSLDEIDQIVLGDGADGLEKGPLEPDPFATPISKVGDVFQLGPHRIACADATEPEILHRMMGEGEVARLVLTDEPYNVPIVGNVTKGRHRELAMAAGEMSEAQFLAFNEAWMKAVPPHLQDGGVLATFIDWRGYATANAAATKLGLTPLNLIVWRKTNAGMGSLYRSQYELLPLFKKAWPRTSTMSSSVNAVVGVLMSGLIPEPRRLARTRGGVSKTTRQSSRPPCWRMLFSTSPTAAMSLSTRFSDLDRPSSPPTRPAASVAASNSIRFTSM